MPMPLAGIWWELFTIHHKEGTEVAMQSAARENVLMSISESILAGLDGIKVYTHGGLYEGFSPFANALTNPTCVFLTKNWTTRLCQICFGCQGWVHLKIEPMMHSAFINPLTVMSPWRDTPDCLQNECGQGEDWGDCLWSALPLEVNCTF